MKKNKIFIVGIFVVAFVLIGGVATTIQDFFLPGSQPLQSGTFDSPNYCDNCHGSYDSQVEPTFNWQGSMMAQAMRDPLYLASLAIANQDAIDSGDLCIRCHSPGGWLEGRSIPTNGSALNSVDMEGVQCHFCHKLIDPKSTTTLDLAYINTLTHKPPQSGNGMYVVDSDNNAKRGPYNDATSAPHTTIYSPFHSKSDICATCHDVSNPVFSKAPDGTYQPNQLGYAAPEFDTYKLFPVERTYSEWKMSAYNTPTGIPSTVFGGNKLNVSSCQDCHMKDVTGKGANKPSAPIRIDLPLHDMTGGNTFVPKIISNSNRAALDAGILRARGMLKSAATMNLIVTSIQNGFKASVKIINETGHKLPSGYPEGRRMWLNITAYDINDEIIYESGAYDATTATLNKDGAKIYEAKLGMSEAVASAASANGTKTYTAGESFHFALNNMIIKDNRIPPRGFTNANFESIQAAPVGYTYADGTYFDITDYDLPVNTVRVNVKLLYQTTSKEYIDFLKDENRTNNAGQVIYSLWEQNGKSTPEIMNEANFNTDVLDISEFDKSVAQQLKVYPNPAKDVLNIDFDLVSSTFVSLEVYNFTGVKVETLHHGFLASGPNKIKWITKNITPGVYILKFKYINKIYSKLVIVK
jgi:hypothetical protein